MTLFPRKSAIAVGVTTIALCSTAALAAPSVSFKAPKGGATVAGTLSGSECEAIATAGGSPIKRVRFFIDGDGVQTLPAPTAEQAHEQLRATA